MVLCVPSPWSSTRCPWSSHPCGPRVLPVVLCALIPWSSMRSPRLVVLCARVPWSSMRSPRGPLRAHPVCGSLRAHSVVLYALTPSVVLCACTPWSSACSPRRWSSACPARGPLRAVRGPLTPLGYSLGHPPWLLRSLNSASAAASRTMVSGGWWKVVGGFSGDAVGRCCWELLAGKRWGSVRCFRDASEMLQRCFRDASEILQRYFRRSSARKGLADLTPPPRDPPTHATTTTTHPRRHQATHATTNQPTLPLLPLPPPTTTRAPPPTHSTTIQLPHHRGGCREIMSGDAVGRSCRGDGHQVGACNSS